jgi:hypothetical protein
MALFEEERAEGQETDENRESNGKAYVVIAGIVLPVSFLIWHFAGRDMARTSSFCLIAILVAVGICWDLRNRNWFWGVIVLILALHVPVVLMVHWPHYWIPGIALVPIGFVDALISVGIIRFVQKFIVRDIPSDKRP